MLVDTSVLARALQPHHPLYRVANRAMERLLEQGRSLQIVPQNLIELWVVATRPVEQNGLSMSPERAATELARIKSLFEFLPDTPDLYPIWEALVTRHKICGKPAHDARLVAAMLAHSVAAVLTFDRAGFSRYPGIEVVFPADAIAGVV